MGGKLNKKFLVTLEFRLSMRVDRSGPWMTCYYKSPIDSKKCPPAWARGSFVSLWRQPAFLGPEPSRRWARVQQGWGWMELPSGHDAPITVPDKLVSGTIRICATAVAPAAAQICTDVQNMKNKVTLDLTKAIAG